MFKLKQYQLETLSVLKGYLADARIMGVGDAFDKSLFEQGKTPYPYRHYSFDEVPYVCLRLPTGGGKTVLASHAVKVATDTCLEQDYPIVLWLVPTNTIRQQTLEALKQPGHPYRVELDRAFDRRVKVLDVGDVSQIRKQDLGTTTIVVVSTIANLRVQDTSSRTVYAYHEDFEPHFAGITDRGNKLERVSEADLKENGLTKATLGKIKFSFANLLAIKQPLVIMDEAHNARTPLTFETLKRIHPKCIIELTATPDTSDTSASNVLFHVSASELKAEQMIKLPIMLTEHDDWKAAVSDAVLTRNKLSTESQNEEEYIRPIVLFQADKKNGEVTWEVLKKYLIDDLKIDAEAIAVATGNVREIDGVNLFSRECKIEYIITIEALKEGWDCSFAYVFCSVRDVKSSKDAEQLLGRVLRMPFAKRRQSEALNRAYAHLASPRFADAAKQLTDNLINMGFEAMEVPANIRHGVTTDLFGDEGFTPTKAQEPPFEFALPSRPAIADDEGRLPADVVINDGEDGEGCKVILTGMLDDELIDELLKPLKGKDKKETKEQIEQHNGRIHSAMCASDRGEVFSVIPRLCISEQGELDLLEPESFLYIKGDWSPLDYKIELPGFSIRHTEHTFEVDIEGRQVNYKIAEESEVYNLDLVESDVTESDFVRWLDRELRNTHVNQKIMIAFISQSVSYLTGEQGHTLTALIRCKFLLVRALRIRLQQLLDRARAEGFQQVLFDNVAEIEISYDYGYSFRAGLYPARAPFYSGRYEFKKHFYSVIEDLKVDGEEFLCAQAIDASSQVKHWVRNLVKRNEASFNLPISTGRFYPDFVAELNDGRLLVVEYKGQVYKTNDDSKEKIAVGQAWADRSDGKCLFLMAVETDDEGRNVYQQIEEVINK